MSARDDFVVTGHALERIEERFPDLAAGKSDLEVAAFILDEVDEALAAGRTAVVPPIELACPELGRHRNKDAERTCWTADKKRGYVYIEDEEGLRVVTVVIADEEATEARRRRLQRGLSVRPRKMRDTTKDQEKA